MATVSFRVPDDLRKQMEGYDIDWAERLRAFVEEEVRQEQMQVALSRLRAFRKKYAKVAKGYSMSAEVIRSRYEDH